MNDYSADFLIGLVIGAIVVVLIAMTTAPAKSAEVDYDCVRDYQWVHVSALHKFPYIEDLQTRQEYVQYRIRMYNRAVEKSYELCKVDRNEEQNGQE